jgi:hypothetical protein
MRLSCRVFFALAIASLASAQTVTLNNLHLVSTTLQVADVSTPISAFCIGAACTGSAAVVSPINIVCPGPAGRSCTLKVHINISNFFATSNSIAALEFVGDGTETNPVPGASFVYVWQGASGLPVSATLTSTSATFVVLAKNDVADQEHHVEVDLVCREELGASGCTTGTFPNILNAGDPPGPPATIETQVFVSRPGA